MHNEEIFHRSTPSLKELFQRFWLFFNRIHISTFVLGNSSLRPSRYLAYICWTLPFDPWMKINYMVQFSSWRLLLVVGSSATLLVVWLELLWLILVLALWLLLSCREPYIPLSWLGPLSFIMCCWRCIHLVQLLCFRNILATILIPPLLRRFNSFWLGIRR